VAKRIGIVGHGTIGSYLRKKIRQEHDHAVACGAPDCEYHDVTAQPELSGDLRIFSA
jgi:prephenate dehydrogenase